MIHIVSAITLFVVLFTSLASSTPIAKRAPCVTAAQIINADNRTQSCSVEPFSGECATAAQAAGPISRSFEQFDITIVGEKAALLSLMLFETGGFKADRNHFPAPGNPGQGSLLANDRDVEKAALLSLMLFETGGFKADRNHFPAPRA